MSPSLVSGSWIRLRTVGPMSEVVQIDGENRLREALAEPVAVIYKHSPQCWISALAQRQVKRFAKEHGEVPVYRVDVLYDRGLSQKIADATEVGHASPQAIVIRDGVVAGKLSHLSISSKNLAQLAGVG